MSEVLSTLWPARSKWYNIGIHIGIEIGHLDAIKLSNVSNVDICFTEFLTLWLRQSVPPPTWSSIVAALKSSLVNLTQLAEMIEARYLQLPDESKKPPNWYRHISEVEQLDSRQKALLNETLRMESEDIQMKFNLLCSKFFVSLANQRVPVQTLTDYLKDLEPLKSVKKVSKSYE